MIKNKSASSRLRYKFTQYITVLGLPVADLGTKSGIMKSATSRLQKERNSNGWHCQPITFAT